MNLKYNDVILFEKGIYFGNKPLLCIVLYTESAFRLEGGERGQHGKPGKERYHRLPVGTAGGDRAHAGNAKRRNTVALPLTYIEGTCVEMLENKKLRRDNTSGHTGVINTQKGWVAKISFKGKLYYLGTYQDFALAVKARERAEEELHGSFLDWYYRTYPERHEETPPKAPQVAVG